MTKWNGIDRSPLKPGRKPLRRQKKWNSPKSTSPTVAAVQLSPSLKTSGKPSAGLARGQKPIKPVSKKRAALNRERRKVLAEMRAESPVCAMPGCDKPGVDGHELLRRSAAGSITDKENIRLLCRADHEYVTAHPKWALENGWQISRFRRYEDADNDEN